MQNFQTINIIDVLLGVFLQKHTSSIKLLTAIIFVAIGLWLIYETLRVWGILPLFAST